MLDNPFRERIPTATARDAIRIKTKDAALIRSMRLAATAWMLVAAFLPGAAAPGPIGVSQTGRHFVDANGEPFYFLADTQWELFRRYSFSEAKLILENRKAKGFTVVMVMLTGVGDGTGPNLDGHHPWLNDDPATPSPAYFTHVDAVVRLAQANDIQLLIGIYHQTSGSRMTVANAGPWAAWVTGRYRDYPNILWTLYPKATDRYKPIISKLAEGIREGDGGRHLVPMHPDPSPASSGFMHAEPWLRFNSIQVWNQIRSIYPLTLADYRQTPAKPVTMLEGVYEGGEEYGYPITPLLVRREAYYTCLAGGFHGYGHNDSWRIKPRWRAALDDPGAHQMTILKNVFTGLADWWTLVPDQTVLSTGGNTNGDVLNLSARSTTGKWIIAYIAEQPDINVNLAKITAAASASAKWINPATGSEEFVGTYPASGPQSFQRPAEWQDALLVVSAEISGQHSSAPGSANIGQPNVTPAKGPLRVHPVNPPASKLPASGGRKGILNDTDHSYFWTGLKADGPDAQRAWVWENFTRGNQCLFMDPYLERLSGYVSACSLPINSNCWLGLLGGLLLGCPVRGAEEPLVLPVWPGAVPGDYGTIGPERVRAPSEAPTKNAKWITGVTKPTITVFRPARDKNTGTAILICPGGGYWNLAWDLEGEEVAAWLNTVGVTALVLKYRVPRRLGQPEPLPAPGPLLDAQRAVSLIRSRALDWGIERIGILGFSAGGHLAVATATHFDQRGYEPIDEIDKLSCRPDFAVAVYPGYFIEQQPAGVEINKDVLAPYIRVPTNTPPVFLVHASDDTVAGAENSVVMYLALKRASVAAELHVYAQGGHGFGVRRSSLPCSTWTDRCAAWLQNQGMLGTKTK